MGRSSVSKKWEAVHSVAAGFLRCGAYGAKGGQLTMGKRVNGFAGFAGW